MADLVNLAIQLDHTLARRPAITPREVVYAYALQAYRAVHGGRRLDDKRTLTHGWDSTADHNLRLALVAVWHERNPAT